MTRPIALITGATGGLGHAFAHRLARNGYDLILTARREPELNELATTITTRYGTECTVIPCDLGSATARAEFVATIRSKDIAVDMLVNNAGYGAHGDVVSEDPARLLGMIDLNCTALVDLTREFLPQMVANRRGTIIQVASVAGYQPLPHMAVYAASKAFVVSFGQALHTELKGTGVKHLVLCPGPTETPFWDVAEASDVMTQRRTSEQVVGTCFKALAKGQHTVIDGTWNAVQAQVAKMSPYAIVEPIARKIVRHRGE